MSKDKKRAMPADPFDAWREWLTRSERDWNRYFNEMMGTDAYAQLMGGWMNGLLFFQRNLGEAVERYLTTFNVPTRSDVLEVGERLSQLEERLRGLESALRAGGAEGASEPVARRPPRTRRPPAAAEPAGESARRATSKPKKKAGEKAAKTTD